MVTKAKLQLSRHRWWAITALSLLFVQLALYASGRVMGPLELRVFVMFFSMSSGLEPAALVITQAGNAWVLLGLVGLLFVVKWRPEPALAILRVGVLAYAITEITKFFVSRPRPYGLLADVVAREDIVRGTGFPSGHTAFATAVSITLVQYLPRKWRWLPIPWIGLVAWSRLYLGAHSPLDVAGGFLLGLIIALVCIELPVWGVKNTKKS